MSHGLRRDGLAGAIRTAIASITYSLASRAVELGFDLGGRRISNPKPRKLTVSVDEGRPFDALGAPVRRLIHPSTVGSVSLGVSICLMEPGQEIRRHRHVQEEAYFVLRGTGTMYLEGEGEIRLVPGLSVYIPSERAHGQINDGQEPLHLLCSLAPPPVEGEPPRFVIDGADAPTA